MAWDGDLSPWLCIQAFIGSGVTPKCSRVTGRGSVCSWFSSRSSSPLLFELKDKRQDDLVASVISGRCVAAMIGSGGIGGIKLRFRVGVYAAGFDGANSQLLRMGELCLRDIVPPLEFTSVTLESN